MSEASELEHHYPHRGTHASCLRTCSDGADAVLEHSLDTLGTWVIRSVAHFLVWWCWVLSVHSAASLSPAHSLPQITFAVNSVTPRESLHLGLLVKERVSRTAIHCGELVPTVLKDRMASYRWSLRPVWAFLQRDKWHFLLLEHCGSLRENKPGNVLFLFFGNICICSGQCQ